ncbi:hypothetical protein QQF64_012171 [Cirrhinus molitorella]|uniref:Uncharacterized protein n=1 Tax=Cirrhinus molitorella TaxID=172907 RepID=A0ABR3LUQ4_9TELE
MRGSQSRPSSLIPSCGYGQSSSRATASIIEHKEKGDVYTVQKTRAAELSGGGEEIPAALRGSSHGQPQKARLLKGGGEEEERREGCQDWTA